MKKILIKNNRGFTLVETLVGLVIFTTSILALMAVLASSVASTNNAKQKIIAGYLAQEGIEYMRNDRDNSVLYNAGGSQAGWEDFQEDVLAQNYPITDLDFTNFTRVTGATLISADEVKIFSTVSWTQSSGDYNVSFSESLFNWVE